MPHLTIMGLPPVTAASNYRASLEEASFLWEFLYLYGLNDKS
jgi:hypothetical protein